MSTMKMNLLAMVAAQAKTKEEEKPKKKKGFPQDGETHADHLRRATRLGIGYGTQLFSKNVAVSYVEMHGNYYVSIYSMDGSTVKREAFYELEPWTEKQRSISSVEQVPEVRNAIIVAHTAEIEHSNQVIKVTELQAAIDSDPEAPGVGKLLKLLAVHSAKVELAEKEVKRATKFLTALTDTFKALETEIRLSLTGESHVSELELRLIQLASERVALMVKADSAKKREAREAKAKEEQAAKAKAKEEQAARNAAHKAKAAVVKAAEVDKAVKKATVSGNKSLLAAVMKAK